MEEHVFVDGATRKGMQHIVLFERMLQHQIKRGIPSLPKS